MTWDTKNWKVSMNSLTEQLSVPNRVTTPTSELRPWLSSKKKKKWVSVKQSCKEKWDQNEMAFMFERLFLGVLDVLISAKCELFKICFQIFC